MAVRLDINADVRGQRQVDSLNRSVSRLGRQARTSAASFGSLEAAAVRGRASFAALGTTLRVGLVGGLVAVGFGIQRFLRDTFEAGNLIESLEIRFQLLFGSVREGARAFDVLNEFAARVPFSLEEIAGASGNLAVISADADALSRNLQITGNVAAATGLNFRQTAEQIQRAFAGGIAAADVFRERGVRAMLGFEAGVTVSVEETQRRFEEVFGPGGTFGNATELLARTLTGQVSLVQDAYFQFRRIVQEQFFDSFTNQIRGLVGDFQTNATRLEEIATRVGQGIGRAFINIERAIRFIADNWTNLNRAVTIFVGLRVTTLVAGMGAALVQAAIAMRTLVAGQVALNVAMRANLFGVLVTAVGLATGAIFAFREEIVTFLQPAIDRMNGILRTLGDSFINIINVGRRLAGFEPLSTFTEDAIAAQEAVALATREVENFERQLSLLDNRRSLEDAALADIRAQSAELAAQAETAKALLTEELNSNRALLVKNRLTGELTDMQRQILMIENEILQHRIAGGEALSLTAEQIFAQREATSKERDDVEEIVSLEQRRNRFLAERAALTRMNFQETVRAAEQAQRAIENERAATNRERGSLDGRDPVITQEQIENIMRIDQAWIVVGETLNDIGETIGNDLVDGILAGDDAMETLRNTARSVLGDIARQLASSGFSQLLSGGIPGGASGGGISGIFGSIRGVLGFNQGGIVPGGAPYTDRVPALLTPGERVIPRDQVNNSGAPMSNITNINISGNVDQRSIDQIKSVIANSSMEIGTANRQFTNNTRGLRGRNR